MAYVSVTFVGLDELAANLRRLALSAPPKADELAMLAAEKAKEAGDPLTPYKTGYLRSCNRVRPGAPGEAEFYNDCPYASFVCFGHHTTSVPPGWVAARDWMTPATLAGQQYMTSVAGTVMEALLA